MLATENLLTTKHNVVDVNGVCEAAPSCLSQGHALNAALGQVHAQQCMSYLVLVTSRSLAPL
jgi:hypothetical protein